MTSSVPAAASAPRGGGRPRAGSRRDDILREAARLFAAHGFHGVSIEQLGAAIGISGPGIYRHFPSKNAILAAMLVGISEKLDADGAAAVRAHPDPRDALAELVSLHVAFALDEPYLITVQDRDLASLPRADGHRVRRLQRAYVETWAGVLRRLHRQLGTAESRARAHALFGLINSTPHSATELGRPEMATLLHGMAMTAALAPALGAGPGTTG